MDAELYSRIFLALAIALVGGLAFMAAGHAWMAVGAKLQRRNPFAGQILLEPGHRARQSLQKLDRSYYVCLSTLLAYGLLFVVAFALPTGSLPFDASAWVWLALSALVIAASLILPVQVVRLKRARSRLAIHNDRIRNLRNSHPPESRNCEARPRNGPQNATHSRSAGYTLRIRSL